VIEHFDGASLKNVLLVIFEYELIKLSFFPVFSPEPGVQFKGIKSINLNTSADIESFLVKVLRIIISLVKRLQKVNVNESRLLLISEPNQLIARQLICKTELVQH
jgi:hypothetical protein